VRKETALSLDTITQPKDFLKSQLNTLRQNTQFSIIQSFSEFQQIATDWNSLLSNSGRDYVFLRHEWFATWWKSFGKDSELFVIIARYKGRLILVAPLMIGRWKIRMFKPRCLKFIENDESPRCEIIVHPQFVYLLPHFYEFLIRHSHKWDLALFRNMPAFSPTFISLKQFLKNCSLRHGFQNGLASPYIQFAGQWEQYLMSLSKRFRRSVRQCRKNMLRYNNVTCEKIVASPSEAQKIMNTLAHIGQQSWKNPIRTDISSGQARRMFFKELNAHNTTHKWLKIWVLRVAGRPVAFQYMLTYNDITYLLRSEFDEAYRHLSPGSTLQTFVIEDFFNSGGKIFDFCGGEEAYKHHWTNHINYHKNVFIFSAHIKSHLLYALEFHLIKKLRNIIHSTPKKHKFLSINGFLWGNLSIIQKLRSFIIE
jgi:CelD/BcsL family acetyltransferase involved in cellulose biosynthesis